jgi:hypothetical protein
MTQPLKAELAEALGLVSDLADEALDPELTREELVAKVKEIAEASEMPDDEEDEEGEDPDADLDEE